MATRPTQDFVWATTGLKTDPGAGKKDVGFLTAERPPARWFNYLFNLIAQWLGYLDVTLQDASNTLPGLYVIRRWLTLPTGVTVAAGSTNSEVIVDTLAATTQTNTTLTTHQSTVDPDAPFDYFSLNVQNAAVNQGVSFYSCSSTGTANRIFALLDQVVAIVEIPVYLTAIGANGVDVGFGFTQSPDTNNPAGSDTWCMFIKESADTNWQAKAANGSGATTVDTGVPPVVNTWQQFRLEFHGASTPVGVANGDATVLFYIDGELVATISDANVPTAANGGMGLNAHARADATGPAADLSMRGGPIQLAWKPFLTP